mmetsp:Transcript_29342/g.47116  ORF Transcript_29342/g.47116 Transcript_29342/m.47116 type:complete len:208 (-) Transcript_29342:361-984(-)
MLNPAMNFCRPELRLPTWLKTLYCSDMDHGCASGNGSAYPMAYKIPKTPPSPPVLPTFLSMTYPTVSCVHSPRALNVMLHAWGGVVTRIPVAWMVPANGPVWVPTKRESYHTRLGSNGSTLNEWKLALASGNAASSLKLLNASRNFSLDSGPTTGATKLKSAARRAGSLAPLLVARMPFVLAMSSSGAMGKVLEASITASSIIWSAM